MRKNRIFYMLFAVSCLIFSIVYQSRLASVLLIAAVGYFVLMIIVTAINLFFISAGFEQTGISVMKNAPFEIIIRLKNRFIFAYAPVELVCKVPDRDIGVFSAKRIYAALSPRARIKLALPAMHSFRGIYTAEIKRVAVYDPLRIIRFSKPSEARLPLVFLPRRMEIGELLLTAQSEQSVNHDALKKGERDDFSHVSDYRDGDVFRLIHWKMTAKLDRMMIKQYDEVTESRAVILCDYNFAEPASALMRRTDAMIEAAIAFSISLVREGVRTAVDFGSQSAFSEFSDEEGFEQFYTLMAQLPQTLETEDYRKMLQRYAAQPARVVILLTASADEEILSIAEEMSHESTVVFAYLSFDAGAAIPQHSGEFLFLNLRGGSESALKQGAEELRSLSES